MSSDLRSSIVHRERRIVGDRARCHPLFCVSPLSAQNDARTIVEEAQRRAESKSQRYEGLLQVLDSKGKIADKRWLFMRLGSHGRSKAVLRFCGASRGQRGGAADREPSRSRLRPVDVDAGAAARAAHRAAGSIDEILRNRLQLRRSRRARRRSVQLSPARRRDH